MTFKVALPDLVSNSYFPAIAAVELGHFKEENIAMKVINLFKVLYLEIAVIFIANLHNKGFNYKLI